MKQYPAGPNLTCLPQQYWIGILNKACHKSMFFSPLGLWLGNSIVEKKES